MAWIRSLAHEADLILGLVLSICLGMVLGVFLGQPLGRLICGSAIGVAALMLYIVSYSVSAIWMIGTQQGLVVVTVFVWCMLLSSALAGTLKLTSLWGMLG